MFNLVVSGIVDYGSEQVRDSVSMEVASVEEARRAYLEGELTPDFSPDYVTVVTLDGEEVAVLLDF